MACRYRNKNNKLIWNSKFEVLENNESPFELKQQSLATKIDTYENARQKTNSNLFANQSMSQTNEVRILLAIPFENVVSQLMLEQYTTKQALKNNKPNYQFLNKISRK